MSIKAKPRNCSVSLDATLFIGSDGSDSRGIATVSNLTETEARAIRDLWIECPNAGWGDIRDLAVAPKVQWFR